MSNKLEKVCWVLSYIEHFLVFVSVLSGCISVSSFAVFPSYESIIKKKKKKQEAVLLAKNELNTINRVLISKPKALIDP